METILHRLGGTGGNVKTMVLCKRNQDFEGWRGSQETFCAAVCAQCCSTCFSERRFLRFVCRFGIQMGPLESFGYHFLVTLGILFQKSIFLIVWVQFWEVPAAGAGLVKYTEYVHSGSRPATPAGCGEYVDI